MEIDYPLSLVLSMTVFSLIVSTLIARAVPFKSFPLPLANKRIGCVDGLRGYLALAVLANHFVIWMQIARYGGKWDFLRDRILNNFGAGGVALFFMITGLVFYPRILTGFRETTWISVYITRFFRLVPMIVFSIAVITFIIYCRTGNKPGLSYIKNVMIWISGWKEPPLLDYDDSGRINIYVLWSLAFEWIFYILILPACAFARDMTRGKMPSWCIPCALLIVSLASRGIDFPRNPPQYLPLFAIGMICYEIRSLSWIQKSMQTPKISALAALSLVLGLTTAPTPYGVVQMLLIGFFFLAIVCGNNFIGAFSTRGSLILGECSYGIYLLHGIVLNILFVEGASLVKRLPSYLDFWLMPIAAVLITILTPITYLLLERPSIKTGAWLSKSVTGRRLKATAAQIEVAP